MEVGEYKRKRVLSVFSLVMINVIAIDSLRGLPISAEYGFSLVFYYLCAAILFFIPTALVAAELATAWPQTGGVYVWVSEAFGRRVGFITIWMQWIYNVVWYPTIMIFVASSIAYAFDPSLSKNPTFLVIMTIGLFWLATLANCFGMRISSLASTIGALAGTLLPMTLIIILGAFWLASTHTSEIQFTVESFFPQRVDANNLGFLLVILYGLMGMEMSAAHAEEVRNPQRDYPRALLYSTIIIFLTLVFSSLAIALVIPRSELQLVSGLHDAFAVFLTAYGLKWLMPILAILIALGSMSCASAWIIGPTKGLLTAAKDGCMPHWLCYVNEHGAPVRLLILQACIVSILSMSFVLMPSINSSYWLLAALTTQLALIVYVMIFASAIRLRHTRPQIERPYRVPGNLFTLYIICGSGILTCIGALGLGFYPPEIIDYTGSLPYETMLWIGILAFSLPPFFIYAFSRAGQQRVE